MSIHAYILNANNVIVYKAECSVGYVPVGMLESERKDIFVSIL